MCSTKEYEGLLIKAKNKSIEVKFYDKENNHICAKGENIIVLNNGLDTDAILHDIKFEIMKATIDKGSTDSNRNTQGFGAGATGQDANAWRYPHIHFIELAKNKILCKEGFCNNIPKLIRKNVGKALNMLGEKLVEICQINNMEMFHDDERQAKFSKGFEQELMVTFCVWFEQVTLKISLGHVWLHIDVENFNRIGYDYSGVMAITIENDRYTIIGNTRKRCGLYMDRLKFAETNKSNLETMGVIPNKMGDYVEKSNEMKVIENAAIMWMGYKPIHQSKHIIEESILLLDNTKAMGYTPVHTEKIAIRGFTQVIQTNSKHQKT